MRNSHSFRLDSFWSFSGDVRRVPGVEGCQELFSGRDRKYSTLRKRHGTPRLSYHMYLPVLYVLQRKPIAALSRKRFQQTRGKKTFWSVHLVSLLSIMTQFARITYKSLTFHLKYTMIFARFPILSGKNNK